MEHELWTEISNNFYNTAQDYKDGKIDYRFVWKWFQEQSKNYNVERVFSDISDETGDN